MKLKSEDNQEIVVGTAKEMSFSIDDSNPVIFDILRNKMYTNKIGAICREVSSNARDANRESGLGDQPIEIEFTATNNIYNVGDVCIVFRDFGQGIDPDRMENIFMKYAASTKRSSDAQTGGFGLGAKTPFAYTDSFIIKTVCKWAKPIIESKLVEYHIDEDLLNTYKEEDVDFEYVKETENGHLVVMPTDEVVGHEPEASWQFIYNAIIDRSGKGKMIQLDEKKTDSKTGTEIVVPIVSSTDRNTFEKECYRSTMYWKNVNYINFGTTKPEVEYILEEEDYSIVKSSGRVFSTPYIGLLDSIPYPIEPSKAYKGLGDNYHVLFHLDVENVTINANRESIQNDEETTQYLDEKVESLETFLKVDVEDYLTNHTDFKDALEKYSRIREPRNNVEYTNLELIILACKERYGYDRILNDFEFKVIHDEKTVNGTLGLKAHRILKVTNTDLEEEAETNKILKCKFEYQKIDMVTSNTLKAPFVYMDKKAHHAVKQLHILDESPVSFFVLLKPVKDADPELVEQDLERLNEINFETLTYSEIVPPKRQVSRTKSDRTKANLKVRSGYNLRSSSDTIVLNKENGLLYKHDRQVKFKKRRIAFFLVDSIVDASQYNFTGMNIYGDFLEKIDRIEKVYVINRASYERHVKKFGYKTVKEIFDSLNPEYLAKLRNGAEIKNMFKEEIPEFVWKNFPELLPQSGNNLLSLYQEVKDVDYSDFRRTSWDYLGIKGSNFNFEGFLEKYRKRLQYNYPMVEPYMDSLSYDLRNNRRIGTNRHNRIINNIKNYIKTV